MLKFDEDQICTIVLFFGTRNGRAFSIVVLRPIRIGKVVGPIPTTSTNFFHAVLDEQFFSLSLFFLSAQSKLSL